MDGTEKPPFEPAAPGSRAWLLRLGCALLGGVLLFLSFPPVDAGPLAFVALAPLMLAVAGASAGVAVLCGAVAALEAHLPAFAWVSSVTVAGWLGLSVYVSLFMVATVMGWWALQRGFPVLWPLFGALLWPGLELFRAWLGPGFPWLFVGYTQYRFNALLQAAAWGGVYGVSFLVVFVNGGLAAVLLRRLPWFGAPGGRAAWPMLAAACGLVVATAGAGVAARERIEVREGPVVGVVQQNIPRLVEEIYAPDKTQEEFHDEIEAEVQKATALTRRLAADRPRLIAWPETTVGLPLNVSPELFVSPRTQQILRHVLSLFEEFGQDFDAYTVVGSPTHFARADGYIEQVFYHTEVRDFGNSAVLFSPEGEFLDRYDKMRLVPFGEYIPWRDVLPFIEWFTPIGRELTPGDSKVLFPLSTREGEVLHFAAPVCYEVVFPDLIAAFRRRGADFLVNLTDEGWYTVPGELRQHLAMAVFRAVETRATVVRAANTGISCFIGPTGEIYAQLPPWQEGALAAPVRLTDTLTLHTRTGDAAGIACLMLAIVLPAVVLALRRDADLPTVQRESE